MPHLIVDGMNVIGSRPTGWWRDRDAAVLALVEQLIPFATSSGDRVTVVFDGRLPHGLEEGTHNGLEILAARRRGRNAADDRIVALVRASPDPSSVTVVTADRTLRDRLHRLGAQTEGPRAFLARLEH
jgi:predicted RNA-binding protein with PIN domain